jgi:hypothetical protein
MFGGMPLAHPLTQHGSLPVSPLVAAFFGVLAVAVVSYWRTGAGEGTREGAGPFHSWEGDLGPAMIAGRCVGIALLVLAIVAGRVGEDFQLENLAPALVIGTAWPLLILASAVVGPVWRWLDPWDGIARWGAEATEAGEPVRTVHWAAVSAFAWVAYSSAYVEPLDPRAVGAALAIYSVATVAGCLVFGRSSYLARGEVFGLLFGWVARVPRRALSRWMPPAGAELVLGVLAGGLLYGALRRSELWGSLNTAEGAALYSGAGVLGSTLAGAGLMAGLERWAARRAPGAVAVALVPAVAALAVALALANNVLFTSVQLLPDLLGDPFGFGWDLLGEAGRGLDPAPLGTTGLVVTQLVVLLAGHAVGAYAASRRVDASGRLPVTLGLSLTMAAGTIAVMTGA